MKDKPMVKPGSVPKGNAGVLRALALAFPGAHEEFPWGERVVKVKGKVFVFLGRDEAGLGLSVKLPRSQAMALSLPFASPTAYGLGKSGWVTAEFGPRDKPPMDVLKAWIEESYRAVAPKTMVAALDAAGMTPPAAAKKKKKKKAAKKLPGAKARTGTGTRTGTRTR